jgi:precorrin-4/cobalt-precorrin-4 C11-methyltransferase
MKVIFVGAGPGDPDLLTVKAQRLLQNCKFCIYAGSLVSPEVIGLIPSDAKKHDSASLSLEQIIDLCKDARRRNTDVIRLHTGDPSIYGAIAEQIRRLQAEGIEYEVVPGVSSFQAAAAALRIELTAPEVAQTIILTRTSGKTPLPDEQSLDQLARTHATLCIFLSVHKLREVAHTLESYYGADCPAAVVHRASWPDQQVFLGTLADIAQQIEAADIRLTAMILVGRALAQGNAESKLYDSTFSHGFREASTE